jgi:hypothetical protein
MYDLIAIHRQFPDAIANLLPAPVVEHCRRIFKDHPETMLEVVYSNRGELMGDTMVYSGLLGEAWAWMEGDKAPWNLPVMPDVRRAIHYWSMMRPAMVES